MQPMLQRGSYPFDRPIGTGLSASTERSRSTVTNSGTNRRNGAACGVTSPAPAARLKGPQGLATVPRWSPRRPSCACAMHAVSARSQNATAGASPWSLRSRSSRSSRASWPHSAAPAALLPPARRPRARRRLLPGGPPQPEIIANIGALHLQLPVDQSRVTAIGYQGGSDGSLALVARRHPGEPGPAAAPRARDLRQLDAAARAGTSCPAARGRRRRRSTSAPRPAPTSTHPSTGRSSRSTTSS